MSLESTLALLAKEGWIVTLFEVHGQWYCKLEGIEGKGSLSAWAPTLSLAVSDATALRGYLSPGGKS